MHSNLLIGAVRGPLMLIVLGVLFQVDHSGGAPFVKTWPVLLIVYAVLKLAEALAARKAAEEAGPLGGLR
jgi:hypothetical protein